MPGRPGNDRRAGAAGPGQLRLSPRSDPMAERAAGPRPPLLVVRGGRRPRGLSGVMRSYLVEREDGGRVLGLARLQLGRGEVGVVRRVREVLGLEGVGGALPVSVTADADESAVEEVARV